MSTFREREAARRARIDPLTRAKIDRRRAEDRAARPLELDRWYWVDLNGTAWPGRLLDYVAPFGYVVGLAELGTTQIVGLKAIGDRLSAPELSDELRREPPGREWKFPEHFRRTSARRPFSAGARNTPNAHRTRVASVVPDPGGERQRA